MSLQVSVKSCNPCVFSQDIFFRVDNNRDGILSLSELRHALQATGSFYCFCHIVDATDFALRDGITLLRGHLSAYSYSSI